MGPATAAAAEEESNEPQTESAVRSRKTALCLLFLITAGGLALQYWYWSRLPERVATHFGPAGRPDSWMNKTSAALLMALFQVGMPLFLIAVTAATRYLPPQLINIPNRDYWLVEPRREETIRYLNRMIAWIAVLYALFFVAINQLTYLANVTGGNLDLAWFAALLVSFLSTIFILVIAILKRFRRPKEEAPKP
ncbi:MAG: DUF1648 domain-containing protein [Planctomycetota bacterium]